MVLATVAWLQDPTIPDLFKGAPGNTPSKIVLPNFPIPWVRVLRAWGAHFWRCQIPLPQAFPLRKTAEVDLAVPVVMDLMQRGVSYRGKIIVPVVWHQRGQEVFLAHPNFCRFDLVVSPDPPVVEWRDLLTQPWRRASEEASERFKRAYFSLLTLRATTTTKAADLAGLDKLEYYEISGREPKKQSRRKRRVMRK